MGPRVTLISMVNIGVRVEMKDAESGMLLADRLKRLEDRGLLTRRFYTSHPPRAEYWFTDKGKAFGKVLASMRDWGEEWESEALT